MIKRIIEISKNGSYLSIKHGQLIVKSKEREASIPCEDIGVLLVDNQATVYTHCVFTELLKYGTAVVLCGHNHHPSGILMPIETNSTQNEFFKIQINTKEPVKKRLWQQIIKAKILHQAKIVQDDQPANIALKELAKQVRSGDPANVEARAAKRYWKSFLPEEKFRRDIDGAWPNNLLNYGYMVMRAAIARAICSAGMLPTLGLHHKNRYNAFCLADDLNEPFRGFVENKVREIWKRNPALKELNQSVKAELIEILYQPMIVGDFKGPLMVGLHRVMASLNRCFSGEEDKLLLPEL